MTKLSVLFDITCGFSLRIHTQAYTFLVQTDPARVSMVNYVSAVSAAIGVLMHPPTRVGGIKR